MKKVFGKRQTSNNNDIKGLLSIERATIRSERKYIESEEILFSDTVAQRLSNVHSYHEDWASLGPPGHQVPYRCHLGRHQVPRRDIRSPDASLGPPTRHQVPEGVIRSPALILYRMFSFQKTLMTHNNIHFNVPMLLCDIKVFENRTSHTKSH